MGKAIYSSEMQSAKIILLLEIILFSFKLSLHKTYILKSITMKVISKYFRINAYFVLRKSYSNYSKEFEHNSKEKQK